MSITMMHFPIASHRFAMQSAVAFECAVAHGAHGKFLDKLYTAQDSIGLKPWTEYAREAGIQNTTRFAACLSKPPSSRIAAGKNWGKRIGVNATPTIIVNGWRYSGMPPTETLTEAFDAILAGTIPGPPSSDASRSR